MLSQIRESWKRILTAACVFIAWTVSTFICHESGKMFLLLSEKTLQGEESDYQVSNRSIQRFCLALILTAVQCVTCLLLVSSGNGHLFKSRVMQLLLASHALATLATNYSMAYIEAASTLAIKLTEPVTMAIGHHLVSRTGMPLQTAISVPIIISGAVVFTDMNVQHNFKNIAGALLAFASNIILTARNLALKHIQDTPNPHAPIIMKPCSHMAVVVLAEVGLVGLVACLQTIQVVPGNVWTLLALCLTSGVFHVVYTYISTNLVLRVMNVVSHSIANIFKRFLVVLLLYVGGNRQITAMNFIGLCMSLCGLLVYTLGKTRPEDPPKEEDIEDCVHEWRPCIGTPTLQGITWIYCPGNAGVRGNEIADFLASKAKATGALVLNKGDILKTIYERLLTEDTRFDEITDETVKSQTGRRKTYLAIGLVALISVSVIGSTGPPELFTMSHPPAQSVASSTYRENYFWGENQILSADFSHILKEETDPDIRKFLTRRLVDIPEDTDRRAKMLTGNKQVIEEAQRILVNLLQDLMGKAKHVMLIELATYDNKGDTAIGVGEIMLLRRLNVTVVFYCCTYTCSNKDTLQEAREVNAKYAKDKLIILLHGGGNLVGYTSVDTLREKYISAFPDRRIILFSQSIWLHGDISKELEFPTRVYANRSNLIMFLRDRHSLDIARANFKGVQLILAPDMAFCIGMVPRQLVPIYDIVWLRRKDGETSGYGLPSFPENISVDVNDWLTWKANNGQTTMEDAFLRTSEAFQFLQRGRVVVTDRLHGHILSTLMNIPHVLIDNPPHLKLSSFDKSWTASLWNTRLVSNGSQALDAATELLRTYHNSLPPVGPRDMYAGSHADVRKQTV